MRKQITILKILTTLTAFLLVVEVMQLLLVSFAIT